MTYEETVVAPNQNKNKYLLFRVRYITGVGMNIESVSEQPKVNMLLPPRVCH